MNLLSARAEDAGLNASAAPQQRWIDGWLVRCCPGKAKRSRCINALSPGRLPLVDKLALATELFDAAGLPLIVRLTPFSQPPGLDRALDHLGLKAFDRTHVLVGELARMQLDDPLPAKARLEAEPPNRFARTVGTLRGTPLDQQDAHAQRMAASPVPYRGWVLRQDDEVLACGQLAQEGVMVGVYDVFTAPAARNRGISRALCAHLLRLAAGAGATQAYLQVDVSNAPALAVYRRLGFTHGYDYHYRARDPASA